MVGHRNLGKGWARSRWRVAMWGAALGLLLLPWAAMQVTAEVAWGAGDFVLFGAMLSGACGTFEVAARAHGAWTYRAAVAVAVGTAFLLIWLNLAVGLIGSEDNPANRMYAGVLLVGVVGAILARFRARGLAWALGATALAQGLAGLLAWGLGWGLGWGQAFALTVGFMGLWLTAGGLFWLSGPGAHRLRRPAAPAGGRGTGAAPGAPGGTGSPRPAGG